ncbi:hypothetical protein GCM10011519_00690 [Marmoricola endophyticus]|uniref:Uncharacterized protein n=1 Tax=Marmoricola endophyticus TaxID=2040280 RepID=A0A917B895_9ACTN|nr:(2Fe-2S) ferredoxin domain-containing protein [Marmoricola endophyticus]GGF31133.1 hypothetical protein GCM10011519_00690 [Marmoricola endophyticus]
MQTPSPRPRPTGSRGDTARDGAVTTGSGTHPLCAVLVCTHGGCAGAGARHLEALRPLVARSHHAVLVRTGCLSPHQACGPDLGSATVRMQHCTRRLEPLGPGRSIRTGPSPTYREVEHWLDANDGQG